MANYRVPAESVQYVKVPISVTSDGLPFDPTSDTVQMTFTDSITTPPTSWSPAQWETAATTYYAKTLIGPGHIELAIGTYTVWVRITDNPEIPVVTASNHLVIF